MIWNNQNATKVFFEKNNFFLFLKHKLVQHLSNTALDA